LVECRLRFRDQLLALGALLRPCRFFLAALGIAPPLLPLEIRGGLAGVLVAYLGGVSPLGLRTAALLPAAFVAQIGRQARVLGEASARSRRALERDDQLEIVLDAVLQLSQQNVPVANLACVFFALRARPV